MICAKKLTVVLLLFGVFFCAPVPASSAEAAALGPEGSAWRVVAISDGKLPPENVIDGSTITAVFEKNGQLSGSAGCNRYFADFEISDTNLKIYPIGTTRMICHNPVGVMEQEGRFLQAMESAHSFRIEDGRLELLNSDGLVTVILVREEFTSEFSEADILGSWLVESIAGRSLLPGTEITMDFELDGRLTGRSTINRYFTNWLAKGGEIVFGMAGQTLMGGPPEQMDQEDNFLKLLGQVSRFEVLCGRLIMTAKDGAQIVAVKARR